MAQKISEGAPVRLTDREAVAADIKSQLFFPYYRGLTGTIGKLYADGTAAITVDPESLPEEVRKRHQQGTDAMRQKWLDGLSDEARNRLSSAEKKFALRYNLLVAVADLMPLESAPELPRKSLADIEAEEARHLAEIAKKKAS